MHFKPTLLLNRLVVFRDKARAYDERFHVGVNIIRGGNSVGKSTISHFIFYVLGGDFTDWIDEAKACNEVWAEITVNGHSITLRRTISATSTREPMSIFWGDFDSALKAKVTDWQAYPYAKSADRESFSSVLFRALGIPPVKGELSSRITMHQLLRLICVDQRTPADELFQNEPFDSDAKRDAIGALLCGVYDEQVYKLEFDISAIDSELTQLRLQEKAYWELMSGSKEVLDAESLEKEIALKQELLKAKYDEVATLRDSVAKNATGEDEKTKERLSVYDELKKVNAQFFEKSGKLQALNFESEDSKQFISALQNNLKAAEESMVVRKHVGAVVFDNCPACYAKVEAMEDSHYCPLCKNAYETAAPERHSLRLNQELAMQLEESRKLQEVRENEISRLSNDLKVLATTKSILDKKYSSISQRVTTASEEVTSKANQAIGYLSREIEDLQQKKELGAKFASLQEKKEALVKRQQVMLDEHDKREEVRRKLEIDGTRTISALCTAILRRDYPVEQCFQEAAHVTYSFAKNEVKVNGRNNFSESSKVILKNSFHLALHLVSTAIEGFRYPRFSVFDNIEDKGMVPARSHQFQHTIVQFCREVKVDHQIIITTSMVAPDLNIPEFAVGDEYTPQNKSLKM